MNWQIKRYTLGISLVLYSIGFNFLTGCRLYSFTGVALSNKVRTFFIDGFYNTAASGDYYNLHDHLTEALRIQLHSLGLEEVQDSSMGDLCYKGTVVAYEAQTEGAQRPYIKASIHIHFSNIHDTKMKFDSIIAEKVLLEDGATKAKKDDERKLREQLSDKIFQETVARI